MCSSIQKHCCRSTIIPFSFFSVKLGMIKSCRDDPLLVKSKAKVSIKYLACYFLRPSVSQESAYSLVLLFCSTFGKGEESTVLTLV